MRGKLLDFNCQLIFAAGYQPLGMSSGRIKNNKITVLSGNINTYKSYHARLDHMGGWCTTKNWKQTLAIDLDDNYVIAEVLFDVSSFVLLRYLLWLRRVY